MDIAYWIMLELMLLPFAYWLWVVLYSAWLVVEPRIMGPNRSFLHRGKEEEAWWATRWAWFGMTYVCLSLLMASLIW